MTRETWEAKRAEAQLEPIVTLSGSDYKRIPYGNEVAHPKPTCRDCGVAIGQLHVYLECCVERCPRCSKQAMYCACEKG